MVAAIIRTWETERLGMDFEKTGPLLSHAQIATLSIATNPGKRYVFLAKTEESLSTKCQ